MKYERLTERLTEINGIGISIPKGNYKSFTSVLVKRLAELEDKIENGTLIELPCKVGDKIYNIHSHKINEDIVECIKITKSDGILIDCYTCYYRFSSYNATLFTDLELAEAKLKEMNHGN